MHAARKATLAIAASLSLLTLSCGRSEPGADTTMTAGGDVDVSAATVRVADITGNPDRFIGQVVTVEADVDEVLGTTAFELDEDAPLAGGIDRDLAVLWPRSLALGDIDEGWLENKVRVTGTVRRTNVFEIEREVGWDLDAKLEAELESRPVIVARSVERLSTGVRTALIPVVAIITTPTSYAGRGIAGRARVGEVVSDRGFWIQQDSLRAFVILNEKTPEALEIKSGQTVELTGKVYTPQMLDQLPGSIEADAKKIIEGEQAFIVVAARDVKIVGQAAGS